MVLTLMDTSESTLLETAAQYGPVVAPIALAGIAGFALTRMDCDLTLWLYSKFGRSPAKALKGKVVWITGASSGIGASLAILLAKYGCRLILSGTRIDNLNQVRLPCISAGLTEEDIAIVPFDISDLSKIEPAVEEAFSHFAKIDILINNAGRSQRAFFEDIDIQVDLDMFAVNVFGMISLTRCVLKKWYEAKFAGQIAVTSSLAGKVGAPFSSTYTGSKFALHGYFESLRNESYARGIRISLICPGPVVSAITERAFTARSGESWGKKHFDDRKRMPTDRCAYLMAVAIANGLDEVWICQQPILMYYYASQYMPSVTRFITTRFVSRETYLRARDGEVHSISTSVKE